MKKQFTLFCMALIATVPICFGQTKSSQSQLAGAKETAVADLEKSAWEAYKNKQGDAFRKLLTKDYCGAYAEGIKNVDGEIADMEKGELRDYSFADTKVVFPSPDTAVMTYKVTMQGASSTGQDVSGTYNASSVWVQRDGKWLGVFHTEVKAQ
jgi:ketosteroid isomerase-like protein